MAEAAATTARNRDKYTTCVYVGSYAIPEVDGAAVQVIMSEAVSRKQNKHSRHIEA
jgi:hypothetical protein